MRQFSLKPHENLFIPNKRGSFEAQFKNDQKLCKSFGYLLKESSQVVSAWFFY